MAKTALLGNEAQLVFRVWRSELDAKPNLGLKNIGEFRLTERNELLFTLTTDNEALAPSGGVADQSLGNSSAHTYPR